MNDKQTPACFNNFVQGATASARECCQCEHLSGCAANSTKAPPDKVSFKKDAGTILDEMADTFRQRNAVYGDNYKMVGPIMKILFPNGVPAELLGSHQFHLFELKIVKLSRFAISGLTHEDSIRDDGVYSAMIESIITEQGEQQ